MVSSHLAVPETPVQNNTEPRSVSEEKEMEKATEDESNRKKEPELTVKSALSAAFSKYTDKVGKKNANTAGENRGETSASIESEAENKNSLWSCSQVDIPLQISRWPQAWGMGEGEEKTDCGRAANALVRHGFLSSSPIWGRAKDRNHKILFNQWFCARYKIWKSYVIKCIYTRVEVQLCCSVNYHLLQWKWAVFL